MNHIPGWADDVDKAGANETPAVAACVTEEYNATRAIVESPLMNKNFVDAVVVNGMLNSNGAFGLGT